MNLVIRRGLPEECAELEALQWRASLKWKDNRADLLANPDAIQLPLSQLQEGRVRVAELGSQRVGFSVVLPKSPGVSDLDGLFVEPDHWGHGIGRSLIADAVNLARTQAALTLEVVGNPNAKGFYQRCGFVEIRQVATRFGPGISMRYSITE